MEPILASIILGFFGGHLSYDASKEGKWFQVVVYLLLTILGAVLIGLS